MTRQDYIDYVLRTYRVVTVLSNKNDSKVLRLRHKILERDLVLHSLPRAFVAYERLASLRCEHLPEIYAAIPLDDGMVVLEEYIDGITIAEVMETGHYHYRGVKAVLTAVCAALDILHRNGIAHRDVKPENIIVTAKGRVVLIDFNASRQVSANTTDTVVMGTVGYASPEQLGVAQSDARTDIYATGVLLNVMLTGKHPSDTLARGRAGHIVQKCTHVHPNGRYQTAAELARAL